MYSVAQSEKIIEGQFEEIKAHLRMLDNEVRTKIANEMRKYLAQYSTIN